MQPLTFTLSGIFIIVWSEMTKSFLNHIFHILNTILLHLHCKQSSKRPKQSSGIVYLIILHTESSRSYHIYTNYGNVLLDKHSKWQHHLLSAICIQYLSWVHLSIAIATISITGGNTDTSACQSQISQGVCTKSAGTGGLGGL